MGGLLQSATYPAGLWGGASLIPPSAQADFSRIPELECGATTAHAQGSHRFGGWSTEPDANANVTTAFGDLPEDSVMKWTKDSPSRSTMSGAARWRGIW